MNIWLKRVLLGLLVLVVVALLVLLAPPVLFGLRGDGQLPQPSGEYGVGMTRLALTDTSREETFTGDPNDVREFVVDVYYPADVTADVPRGRYLAASITFDATDGVPAPLLAIIKPNWVPDAPVSDGVFPVLMYSPGLGGPVAFNTTLIEHLVSNGYVVAAVWHPYSMSVEFPDGHIVHETKAGQVEEGYETFEEKQVLNRAVAAIWADDSLFALDAVLALDESDPRFEGKLDTGHVGAFGHSFGGQDAAAVVALDDRVTAGVNLDGTFLHTAVIEQGISDPFMVLNDSDPLDPPYDYLEESGMSLDEWWDDYTSRNMPPSVQENADPLIWLAVQNSNHYSFTDLALLRPMFPYIINDDYVGTLDADRSLAITRDYTLAFFDQFLRGIPSPLMEGPSPEYPEVVFGVTTGDWNAP